jgi:hypothetical protein
MTNIPRNCHDNTSTNMHSFDVRRSVRGSERGGGESNTNGQNYLIFTRHYYTSLLILTPPMTNILGISNINCFVIYGIEVWAGAESLSIRERVGDS